VRLRALICSCPEESLYDYNFASVELWEKLGYVYIFCARSQTTVESVTVLAPKSEIVRTKWLAFDPAGCEAFAYPAQPKLA
jgi:hypothetical protein